MPRVVALLRGINVGGHRVKMDALRGHFEALKLKNVSTFIASGNVLFDTTSADLAALEHRIEKYLAGKLGYEVPTFIRTLAEVRDVLESVPFKKIAPTDSLYVTFHRTEPDEATKESIIALESPFDKFRFMGRELYWLCHGKISEVSTAWPRLDKLAKGKKAVPGTARNITSLQAMLAQAAAAQGSS